VSDMRFFRPAVRTVVTAPKLGSPIVGRPLSG
jgi:hypothetical protein